MNLGNLLIKDTYQYVIQVDPTTGQIFRLNGQIPEEIIFNSGVTLDGNFKFVDGNQQEGYVLTSDSQGNARWSSSGGSASGTTNLGSSASP